MNKIEAKDFSRRDLQLAMSEASEDSISDLHSHQEKIIKYYEHGRTLRGLTLPWPSTHSSLRLSKGLSVLGGINGHFKSTIAQQLLLHTAKSFKVGLISLEMEIPDIAEVLAWQMTGSVEKPPKDVLINTVLPFTKDRFFVFDHIGSLEPMKALGAVDAMAREGCKLIVLDSMMMTRVSDDQEKEREFTQALVALSRIHECHIMLVHHSIKLATSDDAPPQRSHFRGSGAIVDVASLAITVWHNKRRAYLENKEQTGQKLEAKEKAYMKKAPPMLFVVIKNRHSAFEGPITLYRKGLTFHDTDKLECDFEP